MGYEIREDFKLTLYGVPGVAADRNWGRTGMDLTNKLWADVKGLNLPNKGINVWVYEPGNAMFAGVELMAAPPDGSILELKNIFLPRYVYFKHIGSYDQLPVAGTRVTEEFKRDGIKTGMPYLEIYGHWTEDVTKLETEMLWALTD